MNLLVESLMDFGSCTLALPHRGFPSLSLLTLLLASGLLPTLVS